MDDAHWIIDGGVLESPFYGVLNLCRCLQLAADYPDLPPSKERYGTVAAAIIGFGAAIAAGDERFQSGLEPGAVAS